MSGKRWTADDTAVLDAAVATGILPDGRVATQMRVALLLGFSRQTIVVKLGSRQFPRHTELKRSGAKQSAYNRAVRRAVTMLQQSQRVRRVRV